MQFEWFTIFLVLWFLFSIGIAFAREYKHTLMANMAGCLSFTIYALFLGEYVAAAMPFIAACSASLQFLLPASESRNMVMLRNLIATLTAIAACGLLYQKPVDVFPCLGFTAIRFGEAQQSAFIMKVGFVTGALFWMVFGILTGLYLMVCFEAVLIALFLYKFWREKKARRIEPFPEP